MCVEINLMIRGDDILHICSNQDLTILHLFIAHLKIALHIAIKTNFSF